MSKLLKYLYALARVWMRAEHGVEEAHEAADHVARMHYEELRHILASHT